MAVSYTHLDVYKRQLLQLLGRQIDIEAQKRDERQHRGAVGDVVQPRVLLDAAGHHLSLIHI